MVILAGAQPWRPGNGQTSDFFAVPFPALDFSQRRACLEASLGDRGLTLAAAELDALAGQMRLTPAQITATVAGAVDQAAGAPLPRPLPATASRRWPNCSPRRAQTDHHLLNLARKIIPKYTWEDIVLPADQLLNCKKSVDRPNTSICLRSVGFARKLALARG